MFTWYMGTTRGELAGVESAGMFYSAPRKEVRDEMKRMSRATQRQGKKRWQTNLRASFLNNTGKFLRGVLREPRGRGGAVPERDVNGVQAATTEERMAIIERGYGSGWCPVTPDVREEAEWLTEAFMPHDWLDPAVYDGLLVLVTDDGK
jgi:hypothetical protein